MLCSPLLHSLNAYFWLMAVAVWVAVGVWAWITFRRQ